MSEFKVGDEVEAVAIGCEEDPLIIGQKYIVEYVWGKGDLTCGVEGNGAVQKDSSFKLVTPKYRHGDVYEWHSGGLAVITEGGGAWTVATAVFQSALKAARENDQSCTYDPDKACGKFLYNVFDKESATPDCEEDIVAELDSLLQEFDEEDNKKEAIMPLTIIKTTTTELPSGEPKIEHKVNGQHFENISDADAVNLIREANAEIKALRTDANDSDCKRIAKDADDLAAKRNVIVSLLDDRE
ncbi:MAG: hypothetical protein KAR40_11335 [Candidatus Sabulitectum sp.]|nr:hypothetical protein [Candidatus Sabulitectum sp.]